MFNSRKKTIIGIISGLGCAIIILGLAWVNSLVGDLRFLQIIIKFLVSTPTYLLKAQSTNNLVIEGILFFVYWGLIGGIIGWLLYLKTSFAKVAIVLMIVGIIISHSLIQIKIERGLDALMEAIVEDIGKLISGEATVKETKP